MAPPHATQAFDAFCGLCQDIGAATAASESSGALAAASHALMQHVNAATDYGGDAPTASASGAAAASMILSTMLRGASRSFTNRRVTLSFSPALACVI